MKRLILSMVIFGAVAAQALAETRSAFIEGIVVRYDDERFAISDHWSTGAGPAKGGYPGHLVFGCAAVLRCLDDPVLIVTAMPANDGETTPRLSRLDSDPDLRGRVRPLWTPDDDPMSYGVSASRDFGGLSLTGTILHSACRARAPSEIDAFGVHAGIRYRFSSGSSHFCGGIEGFSPEMFEELLSGIAVVDKQEP